MGGTSSKEDKARQTLKHSKYESILKSHATFGQSSVKQNTHNMISSKMDESKIIQQRKNTVCKILFLK